MFFAIASRTKLSIDDEIAPKLAATALSTMVCRGVATTVPWLRGGPLLEETTTTGLVAVNVAPALELGTISSPHESLLFALVGQQSTLHTANSMGPRNRLGRPGPTR